MNKYFRKEIRKLRYRPVHHFMSSVSPTSMQMTN